MSTGRPFPSQTTCAASRIRRPSCTNGSAGTTSSFASLSSACSRNGESPARGTISQYYPGNIDVTPLVWYRDRLTPTGEAIPRDIRQKDGHRGLQGAENLRRGFRDPLQGLSPGMGRPDAQPGEDPEPDLVHAETGQPNT